MREDSFSIIIACHHSAELLRETLDALAELDYAGDHEIIILDDERQDGREKVARAASDHDLEIRYLRLPGVGRAAAWNVAIREASRDYLAFLDDDCIPPPGWLTAFKSSFSEWTAGIVGGPDRVPPRASAFQKSVGFVLNSFIGTLGIRNGKSPVSVYYPRTWNMAARKEAILFAGGFCEAAPEAPEVRMIARLGKIGYRARFQHEAWVWHRRETNLGRFVSRDFRLGAERGRGTAPPGLSRVYVGAPMLLLAAAALAIKAGGLMLGVRTAIFAAGLYALVLLASGLQAGVATRSPAAVFSVPIMLGLHHAAHFAGYFSGRLTRRAHSK